MTKNIKNQENVKTNENVENLETIEKWWYYVVRILQWKQGNDRIN